MVPFPSKMVYKGKGLVLKTDPTQYETSLNSATPSPPGVESTFS